MDSQPAEGMPQDPVSESPAARDSLGTHGGNAWLPWIVAAAAVAVAIVLAVVLATRGGKSNAKSRVTTNGPSTTVDTATNLLQKGLAAQGAGRLDEARGDYLKVIDQDPTNKLAYYNLGVIYQQLNAANDARAAYNHALQIDSKYQPALFNLAVLETPVNPTAAVSLYQQILAINPNDANVHLNLGLLLKQLGRNTEGDAELNKALQLNPSLSSRVPQR